MSISKKDRKKIGANLSKVGSNLIYHYLNVIVSLIFHGTTILPYVPQYNQASAELIMYFHLLI